MNFKTDTSHMYKCQVSIFNKPFTSQPSAIWFLSQHTGQEVVKKTGQTHGLYSSRYKLVSLLLGE